MKFKKATTLLFILLSGLISAQKVAIKTNLLQATTASLSFGVELSTHKKYSLEINGTYNPWRINNHRLKIWALQPELRYWVCEKFNGHFLGIHGHYAEYNVGNMKILGMTNVRYQGHLYGGGISYGYQWILNSRWNLEATLGVGYAWLSDSKYPCAACGKKIKTEGKNYWGLTKAGICLIYVIK